MGIGGAAEIKATATNGSTDAGASTSSSTTNGLTDAGASSSSSLPIAGASDASPAITLCQRLLAEVQSGLRWMWSMVQPLLVFTHQVPLSQPPASSGLQEVEFNSLYRSGCNPASPLVGEGPPICVFCCFTVDVSSSIHDLEDTQYISIKNHMCPHGKNRIVQVC